MKVRACLHGCEPMKRSPICLHHIPPSLVHLSLYNSLTRSKCKRFGNLAVVLIICKQHHPWHFFLHLIRFLHVGGNLLICWWPFEVWSIFQLYLLVFMNPQVSTGFLSDRFVTQGDFMHGDTFYRDWFMWPFLCICVTCFKDQYDFIEIVIDLP